VTLSILGFDFGLRRTGVAIGQTITGTATPLAVLHSVGDKPDWVSIEKLIKEWRPDKLVVGLPTHMDGSETTMTTAAKRFGNQLHGRFQLPVEWMDERLTSVAAEAQFVAARQAGLARRKQAKNLDSIAAQQIVQRWLAQTSHT